MGQHYIRRFDLSKYTLKSFDSADEFCADTNNGDAWTFNANGVQRVVADNIAAGLSTTTPYIETATVANGGVLPGVQGGPATATTLIKNTTGIADAAATTIATVTIPNSAGAASITVNLLASLGAGGAVGAFEESLVAYGVIVVTRTPALAGTAVAVALTNTGKTNVAGADSTATLAYSVTAIAGGAGATDTFNIQVTISRGGGTSTNHSCLAEITVYNATASGITVA